MATYRPKPKNATVEAFQMTSNFTVTVEIDPAANKHGVTWQGNAGDYLVFDAHGIDVMPKVEFEARYEPVQNRVLPWEGSIDSGFANLRSYPVKVQ